jgi:2-oxoglutarate dehydrogenase E1 component
MKAIFEKKLKQMSNLEKNKDSLFFSTNIVFINELYQKFQQNPSLIDDSWVEFFINNQEEVELILADYNGPSWAKKNLKVVGSKDYDISINAWREKAVDKKTAKISENIDGKDLNLRVQNLAKSYRCSAHRSANLDPLSLMPREDIAELQYSFHGIENEDLDKKVNYNGKNIAISEVIKSLNNLYLGNVGCEFEYMADPVQKKWLQDSVEEIFPSQISNEEKIKILKEVIRTGGFENFLHKRFPGAKRFSVEGGDSSINSIEKIIDSAAKDGVKKIIIGMAHRGRLNVLTGVMGKPYHQLIAEFKGTPGIPESVTKSGDVKYHMGFSDTREIAGNKIDLSLCFNPSHLEAVNPVATGRIRATQDLLKDSQRKQALAILIHGDAAFAGQGIVAETLIMNGVEGYNTGGVIHIITNNQIGFTANSFDSRSTKYASDLAKAIDAPIFHVNGDDVEAVVKATDLAFKYRQTFKRDIVLDIICYRKYGHNEGDEPMYTQPVMYTKIKKHQNLEKIYSQKLISEGVISEADYQKLADDFHNLLSDEYDKAPEYKATKADWLKGEWKNIKNGEKEEVKTAISEKKIKELANKITQYPEDFNVNSKIAKQLQVKKDLVTEGKNIDWSLGESLAFASLLEAGHKIRITGQDSGRGTFSHRHSILHDSKNGSRYNIFTPFEDKANYEVHDSVLSEYGVLGFEYGYSLVNPNALTIWEAQFGDFSNGAQIMFDQFIASSEVKWLRKSGLVMLLPHGYEGQGPEHSSARLERYLQACADDNLRVVNITNPANFFHALRRQIISKDRKPLIVMSPKSLLRHKLAVCEISEFANFNFRPVISETKKLTANDKVKKLVICSGKVYYDLYEAREEEKINDVAIIRLEQFYPFPEKELKAEIKKYKNAQIIWCQEEPKNMAGWKFVEEYIENALLDVKHKTTRAKYVGRVSCASPATGYASYHAKEQKALIDEALK